MRWSLQTVQGSYDKNCWNCSVTKRSCQASVINDPYRGSRLLRGQPYPQRKSSHIIRLQIDSTRFLVFSVSSSFPCHNALRWDGLGEFVDTVRESATRHNSAVANNDLLRFAQPFGAKRCSHMLRSSQSCLQHATVHVLVRMRLTFVSLHDQLLNSFGIYCKHGNMNTSSLLSRSNDSDVHWLSICLDCQRADSCI